uniref:AAA_34 domain-containing protein n=2 Tax=Macrostomum lignano TaxID=282301 RepID=A0A1I8I7C1_9PLAT
HEQRQVLRVPGGVGPVPGLVAQPVHDHRHASGPSLHEQLLGHPFGLAVSVGEFLSVDAGVGVLAAVGQTVRKHSVGSPLPVSRTKQKTCVSVRRSRSRNRKAPRKPVAPVLASASGVSSAVPVPRAAAASIRRAISCTVGYWNSSFTDSWQPSCSFTFESSFVASREWLENGDDGRQAFLCGGLRQKRAVQALLGLVEGRQRGLVQLADRAYGQATMDRGSLGQEDEVAWDHVERQLSFQSGSQLPFCEVAVRWNNVRHKELVLAFAALHQHHTGVDEPAVQQGHLDRLNLHGVAPDFDHTVAATADLQAAVREQVAPVACAVQPLTRLAAEGFRRLNELAAIQVWALHVALGQGWPGHVDLRSSGNGFDRYTNASSQSRLRVFVIFGRNSIVMLNYLYRSPTFERNSYLSSRPTGCGLSASSKMTTWTPGSSQPTGQNLRRSSGFALRSVGLVIRVSHVTPVVRKDSTAVRHADAFRLAGGAAGVYDEGEGVQIDGDGDAAGVASQLIEFLLPVPELGGQFAGQLIQLRVGELPSSSVRNGDSVWSQLSLPVELLVQAPRSLVGLGCCYWRRHDLLVMAGDDDEELNSAAEVYSCFRHIELLPGAKPHPGNVVESDCLATVDLPPAVFPLADSLPSEAVTEGRLSSLQLQGVLYACQRHRTLLPGGERAGFFIGDAAGVGKGRQIAAIILDSLARGRPRHLWLSVSPDLAQDARRDLLAIGCHARVIDGCRQLDRSATAFGLAKDCREGVLFNTYACLVSGGSGASRKTRLEQLIDWCSGDSAPAKFDGCLVLDECHRAKHFLPDAKEAANSKVAAAVIELQQRLPLARVVYCSATGVSELKNLAYMTRLGLWGPSRPFASFQDFRGLLERRGLAAAEMLAAELKATGVYVARGLSFRDAEFAIVDAPLTTGDIALYDSAAALWRRIHSSLLRACSLCRVRSPGQHLRSYWSAHQRFFLQLCLSLRVPAVLAEAKRALDIGLCPVLGLQSTGEAGLHASADLQSPSGFVSVCRHVCRQFLLSHFPAVSTLTGQPETWSSGERQRLLDELEACELPAGGLDLLIDGLGGPDDVAEMTGRRSRIIRCKGRGGFRLESRYAESGDAQSVNASERQRFMAGQKLAAVISDAASTGISLHADPGCANTRRRVHVTAELPWSAEKAVQQLGRTHRSGQSSGPVYRLVCLDLAGERRFCSGVAKRLQTLGALTKADRRAALVGDLGHLNCDTGRGRAALRRLYQYTAAGRLLRGVSLPEVFDGEVSTEQEGVRRLQACLLEMDIFERLAEPSGKCRLRDGETGSVNRFLNRLLGLPVAEQACLFRYFLAACGLEPAPGF